MEISKRPVAASSVAVKAPNPLVTVTVPLGSGTSLNFTIFESAPILATEVKLPSTLRTA